MTIIKSSMTLACVFLLTACAQTQDLRYQNRDYLKNVVQHVRCEFSNVVNDQDKFNRKWFRLWTGSAVITFLNEQDATITPTATLISPVTDGFFNIVPTLSGSGGRDRATTITLNILMNNTRINSCNAKNQRDQFVTGDLGLRQWVNDSLTAIAEMPKQTDYPTIGQTIKFRTEYSGSVTPTLRIIRAPDRTNSFGSLLSLKNKDTNQMVIAISGPTEEPRLKTAMAKQNKKSVVPNSRSARPNTDSKRMLDLNDKSINQQLFLNSPLSR